MIVLCVTDCPPKLRGALPISSAFSAAISNAMGMVISALYKSAISYTKAYAEAGEEG